jgi:hypothetical protein
MQTLTPFSDVSSPPTPIEYGEHGVITVLGKNGEETRYPLNLGKNIEVIFGRFKKNFILIFIDIPLVTL